MVALLAPISLSAATAIVSGKNNITGNALVQVDTESLTVPASRTPHLLPV